MARKILLADDSVTAQNMGRKILADAGYEVIAVNNGSAALKKIAELKPDLVVLDVYMPGYSGLEVCQRLKESPETSRIPVLLTVGKLEPFKPEEAQRVRAEGYIVKPFEASELLSALSKLEDKVVPRAEPSKPGRFARAIAAIDGDRGGSQSANEQNGWKSRIAFPHQKTGAEEAVADESTIYNPMNRDLRTVVETPSEKASEKIAHQGEPEKPLHVEASGADPAALSPAGLPQDVTPEEVAAIAAAAAQIQMAEAAIHERLASETPLSENHVSKDQASDHPTAGAPVTEAAQSVSEPRREEPVTMAAADHSASSASAGASRWTAVAVALEGEEATLSLHDEMQKAHAHSSNAEADVATEMVAQPAAPGQNSSTPEPVIETATPEIPSTESVPLPEPVAAVNSASAEQAETVSTSQMEAQSSSFASADAGRDLASSPAAESAVASSEQPNPEVAPSVAAESAEGRVATELSATSETGTPSPEALAEFLNPVTEKEILEFAAQTQEQPVPEAELDPAETDAKPSETPNLDSDTVKSTAAAWASWRQIRDTSKASEPTPAQSQESQPGNEIAAGQSVPEAASAEAARAVAAGAEQIMQEGGAPDSNPPSNPADVASIVDSVLADLRPRLMAEISRKMSEKK